MAGWHILHLCTLFTAETCTTLLIGTVLHLYTLATVITRTPLPASNFFLILYAAQYSAVRCLADRQVSTLLHACHCNNVQTPTDWHV